MTVVMSVNLVDPPECRIITASDLPLDDTGVHNLGLCKLCTVQHADCGLIWADYPSVEHHPTKKARKRKKKGCETTSQAAQESTASLELALQLEELGLPSAFGTSKGEVYEEDDSCAGIDWTQAAMGGERTQDMHIAAIHEEADNDSGLAWQQAFDPTYGCFYYYRERTQETQWEAPVEGYTPAPQDWLVGQPESAERMITDESAASPAAASSCLGSHETDISLSRLALGDAETPCNLAVALADGHAEPSREHPLKTDSTDPPGITASGAADKHAILHSNAQSAVAPSSSQSPAPATVNNMFGDAVPSTRMESTGMMASIPAPQGRHIRYDANSDSEGRLAQPPSSTAEAGPSETCCSELNSVDQHALLNAVAAVDTPACNDSSNGSDSFVCDGGGVSDVVIEDAMQGVLATTVVAPAQLHKDAQASSVVTGVPDPPPDRQTASLAQSTFHAASNVSHQLDRACLSHQSHTASHEDGMQSAALETLADSHSHDHGEDDQREQPDTTACSIPEAGSEAEADGGVIMYGSMGSHLQSKRELPRKLWKYWLQRYSLFKRFDEGILMDEEGWYSATPEVIAAHHASKCRCSVIVDAFAGVGGNAIQFALTCDKVIAVELCPQRLETARHNAHVYGVAHKIHFICGDFLEVAATLQADAVFLSPPWGGPAYSQSGVFDVRQELDGLQQNLSQLVRTASCALREPTSQAVACFLPRNTDLQALGETVQEGDVCMVERNVLNSHLKAMTVYYGSLASL